jgi:GT2 family glycosyltransferase
METENVTGASILVRRKAFFEVDGFDERYFIYNEDDDICMKFRQAGWKVMYTPHATAIHEEGQSTRLIGDAIKHMQQSQRIFAEKWAWYFKKNPQPGLGKF